MNSLVPSSGSTSQKRLSGSGISPAATASSATTGTPGSNSRNAGTITSSARWSASVTGERSALDAATNSVRYTCMTTSPAAPTTWQTLSSNFIRFWVGIGLSFPGNKCSAEANRQYVYPSTYCYTKCFYDLNH